MSDIIIRREKLSFIPRMEEVPISFEVRSIFDIKEKKSGGWIFKERNVDKPYVKNYDKYEDSLPTSWGKSWDLSNWGIFSAWHEEELAGTSVVAWNTPGVNLLLGRKDFGYLWDLRVKPDLRGRGVGRRLFESALNYCVDRNCNHMRIETQNINVPACRFYLAMGCEVIEVNRDAYEGLPHELQLIFSKGTVVA